MAIKRGEVYYDEVVAIRRGEVYFVHLDSAFGRELGGYKTRPVVVLSINDINQKPLVVTVVPGTSYKGQQITFRNVVRVDPRETMACRIRLCLNAIKSVRSTGAGLLESELDGLATMTLIES